MDTRSIRQQLRYFSEGDSFFESILEEARDCYPRGDMPTLGRARMLVAILDEMKEEASIEVLSWFDTTAFDARELAKWLSRVTLASRAAGVLEGRFAFNPPSD